MNGRNQHQNRPNQRGGRGGGGVQLLTDGRGIYARSGSGAFFNLLESPRQPLLVVGDEGLLKELSGRIKPRKKKKKSKTDSSGQHG